MFSPDAARVWVHPSDGVDPADQTQLLSYVNEPSLKFRTLGVAIEAAFNFLVLNYDATDNPDQHAIVYALPGTYSSSTNGEVFPIVMRDRVHVQGVGARRCVIRGASTVSQALTNRSIRLPTTQFAFAGQNFTDIELLVDYTEAVPAAPLPGTVNVRPPWYATQPNFYYDDTPEVLDGFTLLGGDVQVLLTNAVPASNDYFPAARLSNCVFDLRHALPPTQEGVANLSGPFIGVLMTRKATYESQGGPANMGYLDSRVLIAHNTFIFARWGGGDPRSGWDSESRSETVGIIDVTENCSTTPDPEGMRRGVGSPCLVANVFRTRGLLCPQPACNPPILTLPSVFPCAMLGIGDEDTRTLLNGVYVQTNAFDPGRVGATNGYFFSRPVTSVQVSVPAQLHQVWNCQVTPWNPSSQCNDPNAQPCVQGPLPSQPPVRIWDGTIPNPTTPGTVDPGFVGEYIATNIAGLADYVDWRILPGSPLENLSFVPPSQGPRGYVTQPHASDPQWIYAFNVPEDLSLFAWDGEHWGNARVMDGAPDIGFDERGLLIQAGNWANGSTSHNQPGFMHPFVGAGKPERYFILPTLAGGVDLAASGRHLRLQDASVAPPAPSTGDGWIAPPGASATTNLPSLPVGFRTKYINYATTAWHVENLNALSAPGWDPLGGVTGQAQFLFLSFPVSDNECLAGVCSHEYFNLQGLVVDGASSTQALLRSNMIGEYR